MRGSHLLLILALLLLGSAQVALAYDYLTCESQDDRRTYCNVRGMWDASVDMDRQLSKSACIAGRSWGTDDRGIWVDRGCRAQFRVSRRGDSYRGDYGRNDRYDHERHDLARERERLEIERQRLELEKQRAELHSKPVPQRDSCPAGMRPGRCTDKQRRHGCKDMRTPGGLGCMTYMGK